MGKENSVKIMYIQRFHYITTHLNPLFNPSSSVSSLSLLFLRFISGDTNLPRLLFLLLLDAELPSARFLSKFVTVTVDRGDKCCVSQ